VESAIDFGRVIAAAYAEALQSGLHPKTDAFSELVVDIAMDMLKRERQQKFAERRQREEQERKQHYARSSEMHLKDWVFVLWPNRDAIFYRKDSDPPPEVVNALAKGEARIVQPKTDEPEPKRKRRRGAKR
jgi:hypothetical protein